MGKAAPLLRLFPDAVTTPATISRDVFGWALVLAAAPLPIATPAIAQPPETASAAALAQQGAFAPPLDTPMVLTRTVIRALPDGQSIIATRRYRVRFLRSAGDRGFVLSGTLISSEIDAPAQLHALAELERARPDDGLFPIALDPMGRIVGGPGAGKGDRAAVDAALTIARQMLTERPSALGPQGDTAFIARLRASIVTPVSSHWPVALFAPAPASERDERSFALAGGGEGRFVAEVRRKAAPGSTMMASAERRIVTTIDGEDNVAIERWALAADR